MSEPITIKGKVLIKQITTLNDFNTYMPANGELVYVKGTFDGTTYNNLYQGDGEHTVSSLQATGWKVKTVNSSSHDVGSTDKLTGNFYYSPNDGDEISYGQSVMMDALVQDYDGQIIEKQFIVGQPSCLVERELGSGKYDAKQIKVQNTGTQEEPNVEMVIGQVPLSNIYPVLKQSSSLPYIHADVMSEEPYEYSYGYELIDLEGETIDPAEVGQMISTFTAQGSGGSQHLEFSHLYICDEGYDSEMEDYVLGWRRII